MIHLSRYLPLDLLSVVDAVIQRNSFFAHQENVLLAMLTDERDVIRKLALQRILAARRNVLKTVRQFKVPHLNFIAIDYIDLIDI